MKLKTLIKTISKIFLIVLLTITISLIFVLQTNFTFASYHENDLDYSHVMKEAIQTNPKVVDVHMLGAHDAFSHTISKHSEIDPAEEEDSIVRNKLFYGVGKPLIVKLTKAQMHDANKMFEKGVRYFDIRLSYLNDTFYTKHTLLSDVFETYLKDLIKCLEENEGEFILLDFQHIYFSNQNFETLFSYLNSITYHSKTIFDFVYYDSRIQPLTTLTYHDVTNNKQSAGAILLLKEEVSELHHSHYNYASSIRSIWHEQNEDDAMFNGILDELNYLKEHEEEKNKFRVNQAQKTGLFSTEALITTLLSNSLLDMAATFNPKLLTWDKTQDMFEQMPILMVDYATSSKKDFNSDVNEYIYNLNKNLK